MSQESLPLSNEQKQTLEQIASEVGAINAKGPLVGKPSWRALIYAICNKTVIVTRKFLP